MEDPVLPRDLLYGVCAVDAFGAAARRKEDASFRG